MKKDKMVVTTLVSAVLLLLLIGWAFYRALQMNSDGKVENNEYPEKAVMAQVESMNEARFEAMARNGQVVKGMTMEHVRLALGEPERIEQTEADGENLIIWWYQNDGWMNIVFDLNKKVSKINNQP